MQKENIYPEVMGVDTYTHDIESIEPNYRSSSLFVKAWNLQTQKDESHVISFLDLALKMYPESNGKIEIGYFIHGFDKDSGPYKEWQEVQVAPFEFIAEVFECPEAEYKLDSTLNEKYRKEIEEAVLSILKDRIS